MANLVEIIITGANESKAAFAEAEASGEGLSSTLTKVGAVSGLALAAIGVASVKMAADFQSSTARLVTSAGESQKNLDMVRQGILSLSGQVGDSADALSKAMYVIESGGQHGAAGLLVLKAAAQGAKTENADLATVADAVTSALTDYHLKASDAAAVTTKLVAATSAGKTTFEQLASAMPAILPVASAAHVSLNDILGDLAAMTVHGESAQQAAQNLAATIRSMQNPTAVQAKELALLGMTTTQLADDLKNKGLSGTLQEISTKITNLMPPGSDKVILSLNTALKTLPPTAQALAQQLLAGTISSKDYNKAASELPGVAAKQAAAFSTLLGTTHRIGDQQMSGSQVVQTYGQAMAKATGTAAGLNVALMLSGENAGVAKGAIKTVSDATVEAGNNVKGWSELQGTFNQRLSEFVSSIEATAIALGTKLLPPLTTALAWMSSHQNVVLGMAAAMTALAVAFTAMYAAQAAASAFKSLSSVLADPVVLAIVAAAVAIAALTYVIIKYHTQIWNFLVTTWKNVAAFFTSTWNSIYATGSKIWNQIYNDTIGVVIRMINDIKNVITGGFDGWWKTHGEAVEEIWKAVWDTVSSVFTSSWNAISSEAKIAWDLFSTLFQTTWDTITTILKVAWTAISTYFQVSLAAFELVFKTAWDVISAAVKVAWGAIQLVLKTTWDVIVGLFSVFIDALTGHWSQAGKDITAMFTQVWNNIKDFLSTTWNAIFALVKQIWGNIEAFFATVGSAILNALKSVGGDLENWGKSIMNDMLSGIKSVWSDIVSFFEGLPKDILNALHINSPPKWAISAGKDIMDGLGIGMDKSQAVVATIGKSVATNVAAAASAVGSGGSVQALMQKMAAAKGWTGAQWNALNAVEMTEAGYNLNAKNPTSSAYGLAQFINGPSEYATYGGNSTTAAGQITAMLNYISQRYGTPAAAEAHEQQYGWYASGGIVGNGLAMVGEHGRELVKMPMGSTVIPNGQTESMLNGGNQTISLEISGGGSDFDNFMLEWVRKNVRTKGGGNVQKAFGLTGR